jgi:hypothetical protein
MKKRLLMLTGLPQQGKTHLMERLEREASCTGLRVDAVYCNFIKTQCPAMYFENLPDYVGPHYDSMIEGLDAYSFLKSGRYFDAEWRAYLVRRIQNHAAENDRAVVDGYLLKTRVVGQIQGALAPLARVNAVSVEGRRYFLGRKELTFEQVAELVR